MLNVFSVDETYESPSSRRAWIEIMSLYRKPYGDFEVALLAEGVDRNEIVPEAAMSNLRRPPRGGRG